MIKSRAIAHHGNAQALLDTVGIATIEQQFDQDVYAASSSQSHAHRLVTWFRLHGLIYGFNRPVFLCLFEKQVRRAHKSEMHRYDQAR